MIGLPDGLLRHSLAGAGPEHRIELWARARSAAAPAGTRFELRQDGRRVYAIAQLPPYFEHFTHTAFGEGPLELVWEPAAIEVSLAYRYERGSVGDQGVIFLEFLEDGIVEWPMSAWAGRYAQESRPALRYSPFRGWMNDPNGLCRVGERYHLFYQFHPNGTDWGPMHWGHAVSRDLYRWMHYPVYLAPQQNLAALGATGGAFSGNAFLDPDGRLSFYYTERLPAYDLFKDYKEVQRRAVPSTDMTGVVANRLVLSAGAPGTNHDVRDPKVWFDETAQLYRMVLGASVDGDPAILLHSSANGDDWTFTSVLYRAPARFRQGGARCAECPDFVEVDGHWVLVAGFVGYTEAETRRHNLIYAIAGSFADGVFTPHGEALQELDFGTDFYAMQSFRDGSRTLALAWLFNWEFRKPAGSSYSGEMSLPRVLGVDGSNRLTMLPESGYRQLRESEFVVENGKVHLDRAVLRIELELAGDLAGLRIRAVASNGTLVEITEHEGRLFMRAPEDDGSIVYRSAPLQLSDLRVFFDAGVVELFANGGAVCGTRRSYRATDVARLSIETDAPCRAHAWSLKSVWDASDAG